MSIIDEIAESLKITEAEVRTRAINEPIVQAYYEWKYNWDTRDETTIPF